MAPLYPGIRGAGITPWSTRPGAGLAPEPAEYGREQEQREDGRLRYGDGDGDVLAATGRARQANVIRRVARDAVEGDLEVERSAKCMQAPGTTPFSIKSARRQAKGCRWALRQAALQSQPA